MFLIFFLFLSKDFSLLSSKKKNKCWFDRLQFYKRHLHFIFYFINLFMWLSILSYIVYSMWKQKEIFQGEIISYIKFLLFFFRILLVSILTWCIKWINRKQNLLKQTTITNLILYSRKTKSTYSKNFIFIFHFNRT
jgi:hypothetical protein